MTKRLSSQKNGPNYWGESATDNPPPSQRMHLIHGRNCSRVNPSVLSFSVRSHHFAV
jgi:hypothetical protein